MLIASLKNFFQVLERDGWPIASLIWNCVQRVSTTLQQSFLHGCTFLGKVHLPRVLGTLRKTHFKSTVLGKSSWYPTRMKDSFGLRCKGSAWGRGQHQHLGAFGGGAKRLITGGFDQCLGDLAENNSSAGGFWPSQGGIAELGGSQPDSGLRPDCHELVRLQPRVQLSKM